MRQAPKHDSAQLSLSLYRKWEDVLGEHRGKQIKVRGSELSREGSRVGFVFQGVESIMGFSGSTEKKALQDFFVYFTGQGLNMVEPAREAIRRKIETFDASEERIYRGIFGKKEPVVSIGDVAYGGTQHIGVLSVRTPVFQIPLGKNDGLSDNLFRYFRKGIYGPVYELIGQKKST